MELHTDDVESGGEAVAEEKRVAWLGLGVRARARARV